MNVENWCTISLRVDVRFPRGVRTLEIPRVYARVAYLRTIKKPGKLIVCFQKLETWGVEWKLGKELDWPQIYWDPKFSGRG